MEFAGCILAGVSRCMLARPKNAEFRFRPKSQGGYVTSNKWLHLFFIGMSAHFIAGNVAAQEATGTISGVIADSSGAAIPGAAIEAQNAQTNISRRTATDVRGEYSIPALQPGVYNLTVTREGF